MLERIEQILSKPWAEEAARSENTDPVVEAHAASILAQLENARRMAAEFEEKQHAAMVDAAKAEHAKRLSAHEVELKKHAAIDKERDALLVRQKQLRDYHAATNANYARALEQWPIQHAEWQKEVSRLKSKFEADTVTHKRRLEELRAELASVEHSYQHRPRAVPPVATSQGATLLQLCDPALRRHRTILVRKTLPPDDEAIAQGPINQLHWKKGHGRAPEHYLLPRALRARIEREYAWCPSLDQLTWADDYRGQWAYMWHKAGEMLATDGLVQLARDIATQLEKVLPEVLPTTREFMGLVNTLRNEVRRACLDAARACGAFLWDQTLEGYPRRSSLILTRKGLTRLDIREIPATVFFNSIVQAIETRARRALEDHVAPKERALRERYDTTVAALRRDIDELYRKAPRVPDLPNEPMDPRKRNWQTPSDLSEIEKTALVRLQGVLPPPAPLLALPAKDEVPTALTERHVLSSALSWEGSLALATQYGPPEAERHLFLGHRKDGKTPALVDLQTAEGHVYVLGRTQGGKTAAAVTPIVIQLIRRNRTTRTPVVIVDLKGDKPLYHTARVEAQKAGLHFQEFALSRHDRSGYFDVFQNYDTLKRKEPIAFAESLFCALGLDYEPEYGASYFSGQNYALLRTAVLDADKRGEPIASWTELLHEVDRLQRSDPKQFEDTSELLNRLKEIAPHEHRLKSPHPPESSENIIFSRLLEEGGVAYFWVDSRTFGRAAAHLARLVLYSLLLACMDREARGETRRCFLVVDEFQQVVSNYLVKQLRMCRDSGLSLVVSHQSATDLRTKDHDYFPTLWVNTAVRMLFSPGAHGVDVEALQDVAGESWQEIDRTLSETKTVGTMHGWSHAIGTTDTDAFADSEGEGRTHADQRSRGRMESHTEGDGLSASANFAHGLTRGTSVGLEVDDFRHSISATWQEGESAGRTQNRSDTYGISEQEGESDAFSRNRNQMRSSSSGASEVNTEQEQETESNARSVSIRKTLRSAISKNEIREASETPGAFVLLVQEKQRLSGIDSTPVVIQGLFPLTLDEYALRKRTPWPSAPKLLTSPSVGVRATERRLDTEYELPFPEDSSPAPSVGDAEQILRELAAEEDWLI